MNSIVFVPGRRCAKVMAARWKCHLNTIEHADKYGYGFDLTDLERIERAIARMYPAFIQPGQARYRLTMRVAGQRIVFIYDTVFRCLVTCRPAPRLVTGFDEDQDHG
ncbi:hypothetical protein [Magnetovibrio sp.]|uniref:hypothetical protein n=1 Tax=Magnetovibrio sp. TaxID=2024836 RepID=UPI002F928FE8